MKTVLPLSVWLAVILALAILFHPKGVLAEPVAQAQSNGAKITLHDEPCQMKSTITNLPQRATWEEGGKIFEGCWGGARANQDGRCLLRRQDRGRDSDSVFPASA